MPTRPSKDLETFDNPNPERDYTIRIRIPEFTCLCPKTGQPDFATLLLEYVPDRRCVELKSLKLYIWSFRNEGAFHEAVTNAILGDLVRATDPRWMRLTAEFNVRGGLYTTVTAEHRKAGWAPAAPVPLGQTLAALPPTDAGRGTVTGPRAATVATAAPEPDPVPAVAETGARPEARRFRMLPRARKPEPAPTEPPGRREPVEPPAAVKPAPAARVAPPAPPVYIGIDLGSSHCQAVAIDSTGAVLAQTSAPLPLPVRKGPAVEQDPEIWWQALTPVLQGLFRSVPAARVRRIAVDGTSGTVLLADPDGRPLGAALLYNDARAVEQAARIAHQASADCGAHGPSSALAKLLWLRAQAPGRRDVRVLQQADWIAARLCGRYGHSDYNNCLKLGYDAVALAWPEWLARLDVDPSWLPVVHAPGEPVGTVSADAVREFGLPDGAEVVAGTTDGVASFLAAGVNRPGQAVTSLGSTLVVKLLSDQPVYSGKHGVYSHRLGNFWLAGGASNSGGAVLLQYFKLEQIHEMSNLIDPETLTGLEYYPLPVVGERFPINDPNLNPVLEPLPGNSVTFFQGLLEGIGRIERMGYDVLRELGAPAVTEVHTTGGGARNPAWLRLRAHLLGVPVKIARSEQAAYGTALLAAGLVDKAFGLAPAPARAEKKWGRSE